MAYTDKTAANIITEVRTLINEPTARFISDADITAWLDLATARIGAVTLFDEKTTTDTLEADTGSYAYSANVTDDVAKIVAVVLCPNGSTNGTGAYALTRTHPRQFGNNKPYTKGRPTEYALYNESINVWPVPSSTTGSGDTLYIFYIDTPSGYSDGTILPPYLQEYTILYCVAKSFEKMGKYAISEQYMSIFEEFLRFHRMDRFYQPVDSKDMLVIQDNARVIQ
jgi:hypothetical protein